MAFEPRDEKPKNLDWNVQPVDRSTAYLSRMVDFLPDAMIATDSHLKVVGWNTAAEWIYGWSAEEVLGETLDDFLQTRYDENDARQATATALERGVWSGDVTQLRKDGTRIPIWSSVTTVRDADGNLLGFTGLNRAISERKQAEEILRQRMEELETLLEILPAAVWIAEDPGCKVVRGNRYANELLRVSKDDNVSQSSGETAIQVHHFSKGRELGPDELPLQTAALTGQPSFDIDVSIQGEGIPDRYFIGAAAPLLDKGGQTRGAVSVLHEVSERRAAEAALKESETQYRQLFESMQEVFFVCEILTDEQGKPVDFLYLDANRACLERARRTYDEMVGHTYRQLFPINPTFETWLEHFGRVAASGQPVRFDQFAQATGLYFDISAYSPRRGQVAVLMTDFTAHKLTEKKLVQMKRLYATLSQVNQTIVRVKDRQDLYQSICDLAMQFGELKLAWLGLLDEPSGDIRPVAAGGLDVNHWPLPIVNIYSGPYQNGVISNAIRTGRVIASEDVQQDPRVVGLEEVVRKHGFHAMAAIPFRLGGKVIGVLSLISADTGFFKDPEEIKLLEEMSLDISFALDTLEVETRRKQAEAEILAGRAKLEAAMESMTDAVFISDTQGNFIDFNEAFATFHKFKNKEECAKTLAEYPGFLDVFMDTGQPAPLEMWAVPRALRGETVANAEYTLRRRDTGETWVGSYSFAPIRDHNGGIVGSVVVGRDITESKLAEQKIQHQNEDLLLINTLNETINRGDSLPEIVEAFAHEAASVFACQAVAIYLLSPDGKYIEMQSNTLPAKLTGRIERLIGRPIPRIKVPLREGGYFKTMLQTEQGTLTTDPQVLQQWIMEFTETTFLPALFRSAIQKIVPQIYRSLNIGSVITVPLVSSGRTIGLMDMSSRGLFTAHDLHRVQKIGHQMTAVILRKQAEVQAQTHLKRISGLHEIDRTISSSLDMQMSLDFLLGEMLAQLGVDAVSVLLLNPSNQVFEYAAGKGFRSLGIRRSQLRIGEELPGRVGLERKTIHIPNLEESEIPIRRTALLKEEGFSEYIGIPLVAKGLLKGVLEIFHRSPLTIDPEWLDYLETLGGQAAIAIENAQLFEGMQRSNLELMTAYDATIKGWSQALDLRDKETEGHTQRVMELVLELSSRMGISPAEQVHIRRGALLHDIGKLGVPDHILLKPGPLTEEEWAIMREHPNYALQMLQPIYYLRQALDIPYCHHERWDGSGYPLGLKGEQIPLAARLFAVVDVWDALRSDRPYRQNWTVAATRQYILENSGKQFDPQVVKAFISLLDASAHLH